MRLIWRDSVKKNGFKCSCGTKLADDNGEPVNLPFTPMGNYYVCPECFRSVAQEMKGY